MTGNSPLHRDASLERIALRREPWDIAIIGGGSTGVGIAVDAASRGYSVVLLERHDFGEGTPSRSTLGGTTGSHFRGNDGAGGNALGASAAGFRCIQVDEARLSCGTSGSHRSSQYRPLAAADTAATPATNPNTIQ